MNLDEMTIDVQQSTVVNGGIDEVFKGLLFRLGEGNTRPDGESLQLNIEPWAGGRWFRDRGEGVQHLWGHVQAIKAPELLEMSGPMFMSYPAINHIEAKLEKVDDGTKITLRHRAVGMIEQAHREGVSQGWQHMIDAVKTDFEKKSASPA
ncbi:MAG TPA: SRPBCC domain-containing protein [Pyrinomonadaceae bacterium]|nr:SRPBCC domain-containing protein [Pyrinomonadaceae bacterium]